MNVIKGQVQFTLDAQKEMEVIPGESFSDTLTRRGAIINNVFRNANILNLPPTKGMFVPCDREGSILLLPGSAPIYTHSDEYIVKYREAEKAVRFKGFFLSEDKDTLPTDVKSITNGVVNIFWYTEEKGWYLSHGVRTIEDLVSYQLELTEPTS